MLEGCREDARTIEANGHQDQWNGRHQSAPDDKAQHIDLAGLLARDVAEAPAHGRPDGERKRQQCRAFETLEGNDRDPRKGDERSHDLPRGGALAENKEGEQDGEEDLELDHERAEPCRHAELDGEEQQAELADPDRQAIGRDDAPAGFGRTDEEDRRQGGERKAQRRQQQRRDFIDTPADGNEAHAPDSGDGQCEKNVAQRHGCASR